MEEVNFHCSEEELQIISRVFLRLNEMEENQEISLGFLKLIKYGDHVFKIKDIDVGYILNNLNKFDTIHKKAPIALVEEDDEF